MWSFVIINLSSLFESIIFKTPSVNHNLLSFFFVFVAIVVVVDIHLSKRKSREVWGLERWLSG